MGRDDSNQTFLWRQTKNRVEMRENAYRGVEATEELHEFGYRFGERMNDISRNVDMDSVEARSFKHAFEELQDEFEAFILLIPLFELIKFSHEEFTELPRGFIVPRPVTTTLLN